MKTFARLHTLGLAALTVLTLGLTGCKDTPLVKPDTPENENEHKDHEEASTAVLTLQAALIDNGTVTLLPPVKDAKYDLNVQTIVYETTPEGFKVKEGMPSSFVVRGGLREGKTPVDPQTAGWTDGNFDITKSYNGDMLYLLTIRTYALDGDDMTHEFATPEESKIHQIFFTPRKIRDTGFATAGTTYPEDYRFMGYYYMDTTPWDDPKGTFTGISNPIGLNGFIEFYKPNTAFDLNINLLHAQGFTKYLADGKSTSPFYMPSEIQRSRGDWEDLNLIIPVSIFAGIEDGYIESADFGSMTERETQLVDKLASTLNITREEAFDSLKKAYKAQ